MEYETGECKSCDKLAVELADRDQQVAEACAAAIRKMSSEIPLCHVIRREEANRCADLLDSGKWKKHMKGLR